MSWKSVEMQVALPRTSDAGKLQDQMLKQNQHFQEALAQSQVKQDNQKRNKVQDFEEVRLQKDGRQDSDQTMNQEQSRQAKKDTDQKIKHPYLGNHFDSRS